MATKKKTPKTPKAAGLTNAALLEKLESVRRVAVAKLAVSALKLFRQRVIAGAIPFADQGGYGPLVALARACNGDPAVYVFALAELDKAHARVAADGFPALQDVAADAIRDILF